MDRPSFPYDINVRAGNAQDAECVLLVNEAANGDGVRSQAQPRIADGYPPKPSDGFVERPKLFGLFDGSNGDDKATGRTFSARF